MRPNIVLPAFAVAIPVLAVLVAIASPLPEAAVLITIIGAAAVIVIGLLLATAVYFDKNAVRRGFYLVSIVAVSYWAVKHTTNFGSKATAGVMHATRSYRPLKSKDYTWHEWHGGKYYMLSVQSPGILKLDIDRNSFMLDTGDRSMMGGQNAYLHIRTYLSGESPSPDDLRSDGIFGAQTKQFTRGPFRIMFVAWRPFPPDLFDEFVGKMEPSLKVEPIEEPSSPPMAAVTSQEPLYLAKGAVAGYRCTNSGNVDHAVTMIFKTIELDPARGYLKAQVTYHQWTKDFGFTAGQTVDVFGFNITLMKIETGDKLDPRAALSIKDSQNRYWLYEKE